MENISLRIYMLLITVVIWLRAFAQDDDDDFDFLKRDRGIEDELEDMAEYTQPNLRLSDILMILMVLGSIFIFRKIWKGCSYLILLLAAIFYYITH
jgi:hypothetical protein